MEGDEGGRKRRGNEGMVRWNEEAKKDGEKRRGREKRHVNINCTNQ